jgi:DHA1 family bicyclomycin/chloramphenicol resistance-like MFS transporter
MPVALPAEAARPGFVALIAAVMSLNALAIDIMLPALPDIGVSLGLTEPNSLQFVITVYMAGFGVGQLLVGPISDRFGRRAPLLLGVGVYVAAALAAGLAPSFAVLLALRFVQGLGAAGTRVVATAVVRDRFEGRAMAEVMSLAFMVFMVVPILAPTVGELLLWVGPWAGIFAFMGGLALVVGIWAALALPETLAPAARRPLTPASILDGFRIVAASRLALWYALAGTFIFGALVGFISTAQQIYVDIYGLGSWFPAAFALVAALMAVSAWLNSRLVRAWGMRRLSHGALLAFTGLSGLLLVLSLVSPGRTPPLPVFLGLLAGAMFMFGWAASNMNALSLQPLGAVAGTASSAFGFVQTVGGALLGGVIGSRFDGTVVPTVAGYAVLGAVALLCVLVAERGRLFGGGDEEGEGA